MVPKICDVKHMKHHNMNEIKHMVMMHYARHILILIKYMTYDKHGILYMMREIKQMMMMHHARHILILIKYMTYDLHGILCTVQCA